MGRVPTQNKHLVRNKAVGTRPNSRSTWDATLETVGMRPNSKQTVGTQQSSWDVSKLKNVDVVEMRPNSKLALEIQQ